MLRALTLIVLAGAMTVGFGSVANAADLNTPGAGTACLTVGSGSITVTPGGGVIIRGHDVTVAPLASCL